MEAKLQLIVYFVELKPIACSTWNELKAAKKLLIKNNKLVMVPFSQVQKLRNDEQRRVVLIERVAS